MTKAALYPALPLYLAKKDESALYDEYLVSAAAQSRYYNADRSRLFLSVLWRCAGKHGWDHLVPQVESMARAMGLEIMMAPPSSSSHHHEVVSWPTAHCHIHYNDDDGGVSVSMTPSFTSRWLIDIPDMQAYAIQTGLRPEFALTSLMTPESRRTFLDLLNCAAFCDDSEYGSTLQLVGGVSGFYTTVRVHVFPGSIVISVVC